MDYDIEQLKKKIFYRSNYRGTKEMDKLIGSFVHNYINRLDDKQLKELENFDYLIRIDDDSWFKNKIDFDMFDELDKNNCYFGTGFTWNSFGPNHLETRHNLFNWIKNYIDKYKVNVKSKQLKESLDDKIDNKLFHTLDWNLGNLNIYNRKMFKTKEWEQYNYEFNKIAGGYRYRWGDIEVIGLFAYIHLDKPLFSLNLKTKDLYDAKLPNTKFIFDEDLNN